MKCFTLPGFAFAVAILFASSSWASFAQLSSSVDQLAADTSANDVVMESTDAASGMTNANGVVTIEEDGTYFIIAAGQVGGDATGSVKIWIRVNGEDVANTNTEQFISGSDFTAVQVCQGVYALAAGDTVSVAYSATAPGLGLVVREPAGEPVVPSIIFSAFSVD